MSGQDSAPKLLAGTGRDDVHLVVVCTAERGLCGGFNSSIARLAREHAQSLLAQGKQVKLLCVGRKGYDVLRRVMADKIIDFVDLRAVKQLGYSEGELVGRKVLDLFDAGEFDVCTLIYSEFKSVIKQDPTTLSLIPADIGGDADGEPATPVDYEYEPGEAEILADLLPRNISVQIFRALLENAAGEQGARMSAMDSATRNAGEMIDKLTLSYNRQRQAQITKELIEIISGAEAL